MSQFAITWEYSRFIISQLAITNNYSNPNLQGCAELRRLTDPQRHRWNASSHHRPTFCNVCREKFTGVPWHGMSCEGAALLLSFLSSELQCCFCWRFSLAKALNCVR